MDWDHLHKMLSIHDYVRQLPHLNHLNAKVVEELRHLNIESNPNKVIAEQSAEQAPIYPKESGVKQVETPARSPTIIDRKI